MLINGPGTREDLVADAHATGHEITVRLITDWVSRGLLDQPTRQPKGYGRGSDKGLYSENQRRLLLSLLDKRASNHLRSLARIPLFVWLYWGDDHVPTRQALRALTTWVDDFRTSKEAASQAARLIIGQVDHPLASAEARRSLLELLTESAYCGRVDEPRIRQAVHAVFEPEHVLIKRVAGPLSAPMSTDSVVRLFTARLSAAQAVRRGVVVESQLVQAREAHRTNMAEYVARLPGMASQVPEQLADAFRQPSAQMMAETCGTDILTVLGLEFFVSDAKKPASA